MHVSLQAVDAGPDRRDPLIRGLDLDLPAASQVAVIGPSGSGKTTLLHLLGLALEPRAGAVRHDGIDWWHERAAARHRARGEVFLAPQVPPLPPRQRVVTAVLAARLARMGPLATLRTLFHPAGLADVRAALACFDLADKQFDRVDRLSGGERQRAGLARCVLSPARLWLVDEPLSGLDPARARQAVAALTTAARTRGATLVASFHQVELATEFFPRILALRDGALVFDRAAAALTPADLSRLYGSQPRDD